MNKIQAKFPDENLDENFIGVMSPLYFAIEHEDLSLVNYLLKKRVPLIYGFDPEPCIQAAARKGTRISEQYLMVDLLVNAGAQIDVRTVKAAIDHNHEELALQLIERLPPNALALGFKELSELANDRHMAKLRGELNRIDGNNQFDQDYLRELMIKGMIDDIKFYLDSFDPHQLKKLLNQEYHFLHNNVEIKYNFLGLACSRFISTKNEEIVKLLITHGSQVNLTISSGSSPLSVCVRYPNLACFKILIDAGARLDAVIQGRKPMDFIEYCHYLLRSRLVAYEDIKPLLIYLIKDAIIMPEHMDDDAARDPNLTLKSQCFLRLLGAEEKLNELIHRKGLSMDDLLKNAFISRSQTVDDMILNLMRVPDHDRERAIDALADVLARTKYQIFVNQLRFPNYFLCSHLNELGLHACYYPRMDETDTERVQFRELKILALKDNLKRVIKSRLNQNQ